MSVEKERIESIVHESRHPFAMGILAGTAVGVGLGLLAAPRRGAELRKQVGEQASSLKSTATDGYHKVSDTAGVWAHKSADAYGTARHYVVVSANETQRYLRDVAGAITLKSRRQAEGPRLVPVGQASASDSSSLESRMNIESPEAAGERKRPGRTTPRIVTQARQSTGPMQLPADCPSCRSH